eukprot:scaffold524479_cov39-Prasinocladus_malaysianus.AAC.1
MVSETAARPRSTHPDHEATADRLSGRGFSQAGLSPRNAPMDQRNDDTVDRELSQLESRFIVPLLNRRSGRASAGGRED